MTTFSLLGIIAAVLVVLALVAFFGVMLVKAVRDGKTPARRKAASRPLDPDNVCDAIEDGLPHHGDAGHHGAGGHGGHDSGGGHH